MTWIHLTYFISIIITVVLMAAVSWYSRRAGKTVPGAFTYMWLSLLLSLIGIFEIFMMISTSENWGLFWYNMKFISFAATPVTWIVFILQFSGKSGIISKKFIAILFIIPVITQIMIWTNNIHGYWVIHNIEFYRAGFFLFPDTTARIPGIWMKIHFLYSYSLFTAGIILLLYESARMYRRFRAQVFLIAGGTLIMLTGSLFPAFNPVPGLKLNPMPQSFAIGSLLIAWSIFHHRFLDESPLINHEKTIPLSLVILFLVMTGGIISAGYLNYHHFSEYHRSEVEHQLSAIADLKVKELVQWKNERIGDGRVFCGNSAFNNLAEKVFLNPGDKVSGEQIKSWLKNVQTSYHYDQIHLLDSSGRLRLSIPRKNGLDSGDWLNFLEEVRHSGDAILTDFHREGPEKPVHLSVITPLIDEYNPGRITGYVIMVIDPAVYLYPLLKRWPTYSRTAETLLVRRDGNDVLFLNELRFRKNTALNYRLSLDNKQRPSVMAVLGYKGIVEGIDYRDEPVVAALRPVPDSPWFLVARIDISELYGPVRERFWIMVIIIILFIGGTGTGIGFVWKRKSENFYRELFISAEALRESEAFTRVVLDNLPVGIAVNSVYPSVEFSYMNNNFLRFYRTTREKLSTPDSFWKAVYEDPEFRNEIRARVLEDCAASDTERMKWHDIPITRKNEDTTFISAQNIPLPDRGLMISMVWDVTELKKAGDALKASEEKFRTIIETINDMIWEVDATGRYTYISPRVITLLGYESDEIIGKTPFDFMPPEEAGKISKIFMKIVADAKPFSGLENVCLKKNGESIILETSGVPVFNSDGSFTGYRGVDRDITERTQVIQALKESEERFRSMVEEAPDPIFIQTGGNFSYVNPAALRLFGTDDAGELLGRPVIEQIEFEFRNVARERIRVLNEERRSVKQLLEIQFIKINGRKVWVETAGEPIIFNGKHGALVFMRDITERRRAEEERKQFIEELERSNLELQQFAYVASHDLQEPLRMISSYLQLIERRYKDRLDEDANDFINFAVDGANRLQSLIIGLLEYSRVKTHGMPFQEVNIKQVLEKVIKDLELQIQETGALVEYGNLPVVYADEVQVSRLFRNLIQNSIKFRRAGEKPHVMISAEKSGNEYTFCISDNGIGIEEQYFVRIFTIFQRLHSREEYPGTGIGLSICKRIVERHGGIIRVESEFGKGTSFYFTIPVMNISNGLRPLT